MHTATNHPSCSRCRGTLEQKAATKIDVSCLRYWLISVLDDLQWSFLQVLRGLLMCNALQQGVYIR